ncbi:MAG: phosphatase [Candidatus Marinimicrobia bacterium]|nr:phosphatase [Candidatus Neomarinimicrobiota bacterium]
MRYKHIIWDWNGTLLNDRWLCVEGINQALIKRGLNPISEDQYRNIFTFPVKDYYKRLGFDFEKEPFEVAGDEFVDYYGKNFHKAKLQKGTKNLLRKIQSKSISQSILSAAMERYLLDWIQIHKLQNYFLEIVGIDNQYASGKIEEGMKLINKLPYQKEDIAMIGDTNHDSDVAEELNIDCILIDHGHVNNKRLNKTGRAVVSNLMDVINYII